MLQQLLQQAGVAELADASDLKSGGPFSVRIGSSPIPGTILKITKYTGGIF